MNKSTETLTNQNEDTSGQANRLATFEDVHGVKNSDFEAFMDNIGLFSHIGMVL